MDIPIPYEGLGYLGVVLIILEVIFWVFVGNKSIKLFRNLIGTNKE